MRYKKNRKIAMATAGFMICLALEPLTVSATEDNVLQSGDQPDDRGIY